MTSVFPSFLNGTLSHNSSCMQFRSWRMLFCDDGYFVVHPVGIDPQSMKASHKFFSPGKVSPAGTLAHSLGMLNSEREGKPPPPRQYFPIKNRIVDRRLDPFGAMFGAQVTTRRRELRTEVDTCAVRQVINFNSSRPTHFLALRFPQRNNFQRVASNIINEVKFSHPQFAALMIPPSHFHVTLSACSIREDVNDEAVKQIEACVSDAFPPGKPFRLHFRGLGTFGNGRVMFARVHSCGESYRLDKAVRHFRKALSDGSSDAVTVNGNSNDGFVPHVTLAKVRPHQTAEFGRTIPASIWAPFQHQQFGDVTFNHMDLCEMRMDSASGYYKVVQSFSL